MDNARVAIQKRDVAVSLLALSSIVALCWLNSLATGFVWDDLSLIRDNPNIRSFHFIPQILKSGLWIESGRATHSGYYRPLQNITLVIDYAFWGLRPLGFHLTNLLLHLAAVVLLFFILLRQRLEPRAALAVAALFATHPLHVEEVTFVSGRGGLLSAVFLFAALLTALDACARSGREKRAAFIIFALMFLAFLSKPLAVLFPVALAAAPWSMPDIDAAKRRRLAVYFGAVSGAAVAAAFALPYWLLGIRFGDAVQGGSLLDTALHAPAIFFGYLEKIVFPFRLCTDYPPPDFSGGWFRAAVLGFAGIALPTAAAALALRRGRREAFWLIFLYLLILPLSGLWKSYYIVADRYAYLPLASFAFLFALPIGRLAGRPALRTAAFAAVFALVGLTGVLSIRRNVVYFDQTTFQEAALECAPLRPKVIEAHADDLANQGRMPEVIKYLESVVPKISGAHELQIELAKYYLDAGDAGKSEESIMRVLAAAPESPEALLFSARLHYIRGEYEETLALTRRILARHPRNLDALLNEAVMLRLADRKIEALAALDRLLTISPLHGPANATKGMILSELGREAEARPFLQRGLEADPANARLRRLLGRD